MEADSAAMTVCHEDFAAAVGKFNAHQRVAFADKYGLLALGHYAGILTEHGLLYETVSGSEHEVVCRGVLLVVEALAADKCVDTVAGLDVEQVLQSATLRGLVALRPMIHLESIRQDLDGVDEPGFVNLGCVVVLDLVFVTNL